MPKSPQKRRDGLWLFAVGGNRRRGYRLEAESEASRRRMDMGEGRLLFDLGDVASTLLGQRHPDGPQRVALETALAAGKLSTRTVPVVYSRLWKRYVKIDPERLIQRDTAYLRRLAAGRDGIAKRLRGLADLARTIRPQGDDHLLVLGAGWRAARRNRLLQHRGPDGRRTGFRVAWFCHDLAPILRPELAAGIEEDRQLFRRWLERGLDFGDLFLCASACTASELEAFAEGRGKRATIQILPLAREFRDIDGELRPVVGRLRLGRTVLCVGTLSARKNQMALVRLWQSLYTDLGEALPTLVLAGQIGDGGRIADLLAAGGSWTAKVTLLRDASDPELADLYRHCDFTVLPSLSEGWGLAAGESLWMGKPCLSSRAGGLVEAGGGHTVLFDAGDPAALEHAVRRALSGDFSALPPGRETLRRWEHVARDLLALLDTAPTGKGDR